MAGGAGGGRRGLLGALRHRDFTLLLIGQTVSGAGSWAYNVALAVYIFNQTHSAAWVGAAYVTRMAATLLTSPYGGVIAERYERVRVMLSADALAFVWMGLLAVAAALHAPAGLAIALAALTSVSQIVYKPAVSAMTPEVVPEQDLAAANALVNAVDSAVIIVGPAIGALMLLAGPASVVFGINAATFAFSAGAVLLMRVRSKQGEIEGANPLKQIAVGIRAIAGSVDASVLTGLSVLTSFIYGTDTVLFVIVSEQRLHTGAEGYGYLLTALGIGGIIATPLSSRLARSRTLALILLVNMALYCLPTALMAVTTSPEVAFGIQVVRGFGTFVVDVLVVTQLQRALPQELIARVFGIFWALVVGAIGLGALLTPLVLGAWNLNGTLMLAAFVVPAISLLLFPRLRAMDKAASGMVAMLEPRVIALEKLGIFAAAPRPVLEKLAGAAADFEAPAGTDIVREGEPADAFYVLLDGEVAVHARGEAGEERPLRTLGPGSYFGEIGLLEGIPRTATVTASTACRLYRLDGEEFLDALTNTAASGAFLANARAGLALTNPSLRPSRLLGSKAAES